MEDRRELSDDGYMNEQHMSVVERTLLSLSEERRRIREAADGLAASSAEEHLVEALRTAELELAATYKKLFQGTYFHVSDEQMEQAKRSRGGRDAAGADSVDSEVLDVPEPTEEMRLFKAEEASDTVIP